MNILVIDIGTSSMRGILFKENGEKISVIQDKYQVLYKKDGIVEQSADVWEKCLYNITRRTAEIADRLSEKIDVITVTAQRSSVIPVNERGDALTPAIMWQDKRNFSICKELKCFNQDIFRQSGAYVNTVFSGSKMTWIRKNQPEIYNKVYKFLNIPEYLLYVMTGEYKTDYTYGSRSSLMNLRDCQWDYQLLKYYQVEEKHLCELQEPGSVIGKVNKEFSIQTGIKEGIPVISAGGDQQCAAIGQGVYKEGTISIVTGTGAFIVAACEEIPNNIVPDVICNSSSVKGQYILEANIITCCSAFDWFCKNFYGEDQIDYDRITRDLVSVYEENGESIVLPYFQGRSTPDWNAEASASFYNITLATKRADLLKAILEGICLEINNNIVHLKKYIDINQIYISGGLTNSKVINQMQADVYGIPLYHMEDSESTAFGALMVTLNSLGVYKTMDEAFLKIRAQNSPEIYIPNEKKHIEYENKQQRMEQLYNKMYY